MRRALAAAPPKTLLAGAGGVAGLALVVWLVSALFGGPAQGDGAGQASGAALPPYGVVAVTYGPGRLEEARATGRDLQDRIFPDQQIRLYEVPDSEGRKHYQLFVGASADPGALEDLQARVREASLSDRPEQRPFADAYIQKRPSSLP